MHKLMPLRFAQKIERVKFSELLMHMKAARSGALRVERWLRSLSVACISSDIKPIMTPCYKRCGVKRIYI